MKIRRILHSAIVACLAAAIANTTHATFDLAQIHQVIGGVEGDTSAQAIQLRMRTGFQNFVSQARLIAHDANGLNPVIIIDMGVNVANSACGTTILITTAAFDALTDPVAVSDFTMTNPIPVSYLAAGSLTWENDLGTIIAWRLSWGGASYTGSNAGNLFNDADGNFGPPFAGPIPTASLIALQFQGACVDGSTNNAADYAITAIGSAWRNNAGANFVLAPPVKKCLGDCAPVDNVVNVSDLMRVLADWNGPGPCDSNNDGTNDVTDLLTLLGNWGACP